MVVKGVRGVFLLFFYDWPGDRLRVIRRGVEVGVEAEVGVGAGPPAVAAG